MIKKNVQSQILQRIGNREMETRYEYSELMVESVGGKRLLQLQIHEQVERSSTKHAH